MNELIKPINQPISLEYWSFISKESYLFFESLYIKHIKLYEAVESFKDDEKISDEKITLYTETSNLRINLLLHFCMLCESILNYYGTIKLGERFYKERIEMVNPISKKISLLKSIISNTELDEKHELLQRIKNQFDYRNQFVHPKYKKKLPENEWDNQIIDLTCKFTTEESDKLKKMTTELVSFLVGDEPGASLFIHRYKWD